MPTATMINDQTVTISAALNIRSRLPSVISRGLTASTRTRMAPKAPTGKKLPDR